MKRNSSKTEWFGKVIATYMPDKEKEDWIKELLVQYYKDFVKRYEVNSDKIWCKFGGYEIIIRDPVSPWLNPRNAATTISIKFSCTGRSFYMDRTFKSKRENPKKHHPHTKSVPKRKRGKLRIKHT